MFIKAEHLARCVAINRTDAAETFSAWHADRGEPENWIKDLKAIAG